MRAISRWLSEMVPKTQAQEDLEQFKSSLCKSVQVNLKIIQDFKYWGVSSQCAIYTSQSSVVHQDTAGPHHVAGKFSTVTETDRTSVTLLTKAITEISTQVSTLTAKLLAVQSDNARLRRSRHCSSPAEHGHCLSNNQSPFDQNPLRDRNFYSRSRHKFYPNGYCSSHQYLRNLLLPGQKSQNIGDANGHQASVDMEQGLDQLRANRVRGGGNR